MRRCRLRRRRHGGGISFGASNICIPRAQQLHKGALRRFPLPTRGHANTHGHRRDMNRQGNAAELPRFISRPARQTPPCSPSSARDHHHAILSLAPMLAARSLARPSKPPAKAASWLNTVSPRLVSSSARVHVAAHPARRHLGNADLASLDGVPSLLAGLAVEG